MESPVRMQKSAEFRLPKRAQKDYGAMSSDDFNDACTSIAETNKRYIRRLWPSPNTSWMYVNAAGERVSDGEGICVPSLYQTKECAKIIGQPLFIVTRRNKEYCDTAYFVPAEQIKYFQEFFKRSPEDFIKYNGPQSQIAQINAQSGLVNKLFKQRDFAIGVLMEIRTLRYDRQPHNSPATVADVFHGVISDDEIMIHIASQNKDKVHQRGKKVIGERPQDEKKKITRIERLHRVDDPIEDIYDTWHMELPSSKGLILYGSRAKFDKTIDEAITRQVARWLPH